MFAPAHLLEVVVFVTMVALGTEDWAFNSPDSCWGVSSVPSGPTVRAVVLILWW